MKFWLLIIYAGLFLFAHTVQAQSGSDEIHYSPPSPNAQAFLRDVSVPVSQYTGAPQINLPLTTIPGTRLSVPISLSYHATGNKVQDIASWVGLGWTLNAGGVITRVVRGLPDEDANGYCGTNNVGEMAAQTWGGSYIADVASYAKDGEPDMFVFNFLGNSGSFILNAAGVPYMVPHTGLKINPAICDVGNGKWTIVDLDGTVYTFGGTTDSKEESNFYVIGTSSSKSYISSWYLSEIKARDGETITFSYSTSAPSISYKYFRQQRVQSIYQVYLGGSGCMTQEGTLTNRDLEVTINNPRYLSSFATSQANVTFVPATRVDINGGWRLKQIEVKDKSYNHVSTVKFNHSYFVSDESADDNLKKRLRLDNIYQAANGASLQLFNFDYNLATNLPPRNSHKIDHWGYYNSNAEDTKIPRLVWTEASCSGDYSGADKSPDSTRSKANILTKIQTASGGYTELIYGAHDYYDAASTSNKLAGGVRIRAQKKCLETGSCITTHYYYKSFDYPTRSSGALNRMPNYHRITWTADQFGFGQKRLYRVSESFGDMFDIAGVHVGYAHVKSRVVTGTGPQFAGAGYEKSYFTNFTDRGDPTPTQWYCANGAQQSVADGYIYPNTPSSSRAWERRLLDKHEVYSESGKLLKAEDYEYEFAASAQANVPAVKAGFIQSTLLGYAHYAGTYNTASRPIYMKNQITTIYDQNSGDQDITKKVTSQTDLTYDEVRMLPKTIAQYNTAKSSSKVITSHSYAHEFPFTAAGACSQQYSACVSGCGGNQSCITSCQSAMEACMENFPEPGPEQSALILMTSQNNLVTPVQTKQIVEEGGVQRIVSVQVNLFDIHSHSGGYYAKPKEKWAMKTIIAPNAYTNPYTDIGTGVFWIDSQLRKLMTFNSYDQESGNLLTATPFSGILETNAWNYAKTRISSTTKSASSLSSQTQYTYKELIGVETTTDPNTIVTTYEYDPMNRSKLQKDADSKIVTRTKQRTATEGYNARIETIGFVLSNIPTAMEDFFGGPVQGTSGYSWNFGDGGTATGNSVVTHTYTSPGSYDVTMTKTNADLGTASTKRTIIVRYAPFICANGPVNVNLCGTEPSGQYGSCTVAPNNQLSSPTLLHVDIASGTGCGNYKYKWEYELFSAPGYWYEFGNGAAEVTAPFHLQNAKYDVKCTVVDECGNQIATAEYRIEYRRPTC